MRRYIYQKRGEISPRGDTSPEGKMPEKTLEACDIRRTNRVAIGKKTETPGKIIN